MNTKYIISIFVIFIVIGGTVPYFVSLNSEKSPRLVLEGTTWDFGEQGRISFANGFYTATVGCNSMGGKFTVKHSSIKFSRSGSTLIACESTIMEMEIKLQNTLRAIDSYTVTDQTITLTGRGTELVLRRPVNLALTGRQWNISSIKEGSGIVSSAIDQGTFLTFEEDGRFSGKSACNQVMGNYEVTGNSISFSNIGSTKMGCPAEETAREQLLIKTLDNATSYTIDRRTLSIESRDREYLITLSTRLDKIIEN